MKPTTWSNWSGSVQCSPLGVLFPASEEEIVQIIHKASKEGKKIRMIGSGHSFSNLVETNDYIVSLDNLRGIISIDKGKQEVTVKAGTKIKEFGHLLFENGLAQENLGDIDVQSLAGAISTGTHGTGTAFGNLSTQLTGIKFINGKGEVIYCSTNENEQLFKAAQVSLGTLGIITELTFKAIPAYKLEFTSGKETLDEVLNNYERYNKENRNFEFYWFPGTNIVQTKFSNASDLPAKEYGTANYITDMLLENHAFGVLSKITNWFPKASKTIAQISAKAVSTSHKINWSHKVYALPRLVKFHEMEYNIPLEAFREVKRDVQKAFDKHKFDVHFPTENRFVKGDDIWLSPAYERDSAYIAFHVYKPNPYKEYFKVMEDICLAVGGRPHWGKMHTRTGADFEKLYPKWNDFQAIRQEMDPEGIFLSPYMQQICGETISMNR
ncbi:FAD-binding protein [Solitalea sp. MAHUQ-68]|uniref:FAD-binding protein n=1 Tax=Solitalea agri TaxID=2953739 RepID=A0A9X2F4K9_9SPHI|nr:D-arabinono-1,4-lactone oxidase [Solitalea agri]MCO4294612.1 FAD-binding protein [Solitalea agri]